MTNGNEIQDFAISLEFAKHIAMMARTEKSHEYRNYFLECKKVDLQQVTPSYLIEDFKIYGTFENPLFLAKDVAEWIEHSNARMMLKSVDEEEKLCVNNPYALKGQQEQCFLTEDGLYEVLMQSRKPITKSFKKEVKKILEEIRKTGSCSVNKKMDSYFLG